MMNECYNRTIGPRGSHTAEHACTGTINLLPHDSVVLVSPGLFENLESPASNTLYQIWLKSFLTMVPPKKGNAVSWWKKQPAPVELDSDGRTLTSVAANMTMTAALRNGIHNSMDRNSTAESGCKADAAYPSLVGLNDMVLLAFQMQEKGKRRRKLFPCFP